MLTLSECVLGTVALLTLFETFGGSVLRETPLENDLARSDAFRLGSNTVASHTILIF